MMPEQFIVYDLEFTSWEGSHDRGWSRAGEHREIVQIGAVRVGTDLAEQKTLLLYVRPSINTQLSQYFIDLTGITQEKLDRDGIDTPAAIEQFKQWCGDLPLYAYGNDILVIEETCRLNNIENPFPLSQANDIREYFKTVNVDTNKYQSGTIGTAFGLENKERAHNALNDARFILEALRAARATKDQKETAPQS